MTHGGFSGHHGGGGFSHHHHLHHTGHHHHHNNGGGHHHRHHHHNTGGGSTTITWYNFMFPSSWRAKSPKRSKVTKNDEEDKKKKQNVELKTQKPVDNTEKVVREFKQPAPPSYEEAMKDVKKVERL
ncbi:hypothetical protein WR25_15679 [Diploscapter pachys]|uniref:Uncharacterized protein n=1 Tax=Diploscapter pachys TaxID=2018661 RepID=A0A2A2J346_9BILA|nr:hypothetical protein WR25_15679 [Diploscapter pachys]